MKIAIIGAGFSACNLYNNLKKEDFKITIFEKARGTSGRLSTKYIEDKLIDHGTAHINTNLINREDLVRNTKIVKASFKNNLWTLFDEENKAYEDFDFLVFTIPAPKILEKNFDLDYETKKDLEKVTYDAMATLICHRKTEEKFVLSDLEKSELFFKVIDNSSKYHYEKFESYVFHLNKEFVQKNINLTKNEIFELIHKRIKNELKINLKDDFQVIEHLWRFAFVKEYIKKDFILNKKKSYGICGDYFNNINLESSYESSKKISEEIISIYKKDKKC